MPATVGVIVTTHGLPAALPSSFALVPRTSPSNEQVWPFAPTVRISNFNEPAAEDSPGLSVKMPHAPSETYSPGFRAVDVSAMDGRGHNTDNATTMNAVLNASAWLACEG